MNQPVAPSAEDQFDEETSRRIEAIYLTPDVANQRDKVLAMLAPRAGEKALDIGCGPGLTTQALAQQLVDRGTEVAISARLQIDHGQAHAIQYLLDGIDDGVIAGAAAVIAGQMIADVIPAHRRRCRDQAGAGH